MVAAQFKHSPAQDDSQERKKGTSADLHLFGRFPTNVRRGFFPVFAGASSDAATSKFTMP